jgi:hypothetical protein
MKNDPVAGLTINADGAVAGLRVAHLGDPKLTVSDQRLAFAVDEVRVQGSALAIRRANLKGAPGLVDESVTPPRTLNLRGLNAAARDLTWPAKGPVLLDLAVDLPEAGTLAVTGPANLDARAVDLKLDLKDAALSSYQALLPVDAPIGGEASAALTIAARMASAPTITAAGQAEVRQLAIGPPDKPALKVERIETNGIAVQWPRDIRVDLVKIVKPDALLERDSDGSFPLRAMLTPRNQGSATEAGVVSAAPAGGGARRRGGRSGVSPDSDHPRDPHRGGDIRSSTAYDAVPEEISWPPSRCQRQHGARRASHSELTAVVGATKP